MSNLRQAAQQALEALELLARYEHPLTKVQVRKPRDGGPIVTVYPQKVALEAITALRAALAEPNRTEKMRAAGYTRRPTLRELAEPEQEPLRLQCTTCGTVYADGVPPQVHEQEPVGQLQEEAYGRGQVLWFKKPADQSMLYTAPIPRKPLTDEEIDRVTDQQWAQNNHKPIYAAHRAYARAIERKHNIGEQHE